jgi:hypothetical protein
LVGYLSVPPKKAQLPYGNGILSLPHHAGLARRAFQRAAIPFGRIGRGLIGALQEFEQTLGATCAG